MSDDEGDGDLMSVSRARRPLGNSELTQMVTILQRKIKSLEDQARSSSGNTRYIDTTNLDRSAADVVEEDLRAHLRPGAALERTESIPELREVSWSQFTNKFEDEPREYAIEVLLRDAFHLKHGKRHVVTENVLDEPLQRFSHTIEITQPVSTFNELPRMPDRIRIYSPHILKALAIIDKTIDDTAPLVMLRPYKFLVHFETRIRDIVHKCQQELPEDGSSSVVDLPARSQHLQCLINFIDKYIRPTVDRFKDNSATKISYRDLWLIFKPGEDIFMPVKDRQQHVSTDPMKITPEMFQGRYERLWRIIGMGGGRQNLSATSDRGKPPKANPFKVLCYYLDFDSLFFPVVHRFSIQPFSGFRDITSLDFFPLRYLPQGEELRAKSLAQGKLVFNALLQSHTHFYYCGPILTTQPCGCTLPESDLHQEHVESEVIIDYRAALQKHPSWRPTPTFWQPPPTDPGEVRGTLRVEHWNDKTKSKLMRTEVDTIYDDNQINLERALIFKDKARIFDPVPSGWLSNQESVPEADVALLSPRVFAFILRTRTFAPIWLWGLEKISAQSDGLKNLQLKDNTLRDTIHALVKTHFIQKASTQRNGTMETDLVRGKGRGLIFLLHGAPGVGKTFTAESVAAANGRPLFQITCGDLGLTPTEVEGALKEIFRYAQQWNCVLLLDECDIFLTQRSKTELKRNSLVSVFLRVLEWYSGVLFLTTNRVGNLDSAVKSRITWSAYYPPLNLQQTKEIWKNNLNILKKRHPHLEVDRKSILKFAQEFFMANPDQDSNWNGRQIHSAFKVARSLAEWESMSEDEHQALDTDVSQDRSARSVKLDASHFSQVSKAATMFDKYLMEATGLTKTQRAYGAQERADDHFVEDDVAPEDSGSGLMQEPPLKKQRTWSMASNQQPPNQSNAFGQNQLSPNTARRPSNQQPPAPRSRKSSLQQPSNGHPQVWQNGGSYINNKSPRLAASPVQTQPSRDRFSASKRKRSSLDQPPPSLKVRTGPVFSDSESDEEGDDQIGNWRQGAESLVAARLPSDDDSWEHE